MKTLKFILTAVCLLPPRPGRAAAVVAVENQETAVAVNGEVGTLLQFPAAVRTVTPSRYFSIHDIGTGTAGAVPPGAGGSSREDVRTFQVKPTAGAVSEAVTFVLASGRALALRLIPTPGAEKFYDVELAPSARHGPGAKFLGTEMAMMRFMLLDEGGGFARETLEQAVSTEFKDLAFSLVRLYASDGLTGYVFVVRNRSRAPLDLNLSALAFGHPNRAASAQADRLHLSPCPLLGGDGSGCQTALRLVVRGPKPPEPLLGSAGGAAPPFVKTSSSVSGRER